MERNARFPTTLYVLDSAPLRLISLPENFLSDFSRFGYYMHEMQSKSDAQLLCEYVEYDDEAAFTELVHRYTNLVYSAALRQVGSPEIAPEIAQNVFIGLAKDAKTLLPRLTAEASLAGWLCRSARNLSLNSKRDEFRRRNREIQAMEQLISTSDDTPDWSRLKVVLDDAMSELNPPHYEALVLRYFQNLDFQSVGSAIGVCDDTAQKRVTRALERLRELLTKRGINTTAAALGIVISANAVQAAPAGLTLAISAAAISSTAVTLSTATATTAKIVTMTTIQKSLITATVVVLAGLSLFQWRQTSQLQHQVKQLQQERFSLRSEVTLMQTKQNDDRERLRGWLAENRYSSTNQNQPALTPDLVLAYVFQRYGGQIPYGYGQQPYGNALYDTNDTNSISENRR
jgi:RNA polymerase sigma factor (sigma-70 family)